MLQDFPCSLHARGLLRVSAYQLHWGKYDLFVEKDHNRRQRWRYYSHVLRERQAGTSSLLSKISLLDYLHCAQASVVPLPDSPNPSIIWDFEECSPYTIGDGFN